MYVYLTLCAYICDCICNCCLMRQLSVGVSWCPVIANQLGYVNLSGNRFIGAGDICGFGQFEFDFRRGNI